MKKTLLSIVAVVAMALAVVACGNGKLVEKQVNFYKQMTLKLDSIETMEDFQKFGQDAAAEVSGWATAEDFKGVEFSEKEAATIKEAADAYTTKMNEVTEKMIKMQQEAAAKAAEAAKLAEEAAKEVKK